MKIISNSLTRILDQRLQSMDELDQFIDDLEDEIFGVPIRDFYLKYKGDIKDLLDESEDCKNNLSFESELLTALMAYCSQRKRFND